jgi:hypothetical protein
MFGPHDFDVPKYVPRVDLSSPAVWTLGVVSFVGAVLTYVSALFERVALENVVLTSAGGTSVFTWQAALLGDWKSALIEWIAGSFLLYCIPLLAVSLWVERRTVQWVLVCLFSSLLVLDIQAFQDSLVHPSNDIHGSLRGFVALLAHAVGSLLAFPLAVVGLFLQKDAPRPVTGGDLRDLRMDQPTYRGTYLVWLKCLAISMAVPWTDVCVAQAPTTGTYVVPSGCTGDKETCSKQLDCLSIAPLSNTSFKVSAFSVQQEIHICSMAGEAVLSGPGELAVAKPEGMFGAGETAVIRLKDNALTVSVDGATTNRIPGCGARANWAYARWPSTSRKTTEYYACDSGDPYKPSSAMFRGALKILMGRFQADRPYEPWSQGFRCLSFVAERQTKTYVNIAVREKHGGECDGDPSTNPIVDRFRVSLHSKRVLWLDSVNGNLASYKRFLKSRHLAH